MGYQIPFKSFHGTDYVLMINGGGTVIDGSAQTFVTNEDADTDFFMPVRTQSGTFRYIGEGESDRAIWSAMIPNDALSIPVRLMQGNVIRWQGYIQPEVYQNDYPANGKITEHEFSVQCPLSVLDTMDISIDNLNTTPIVTIGDLLENYIFARLTGTVCCHMEAFEPEADASELHRDGYYGRVTEVQSEGSVGRGVQTVRIHMPPTRDIRLFHDACHQDGTDRSRIHTLFKPYKHVW